MGKIADTTRTWPLGQEQRRQMLAFDSEFEETKAERDALQAKNLTLQAKVKPLQDDVERLQKRVEEETAKAARAAKLGEFKANKRAETKEDDHLSKEEAEIIKALAQHGGLVPLNAIAAHLQLHITKAQHFLNKLEQAKYILVAHNYLHGPSY